MAGSDISPETAPKGAGNEQQPTTFTINLSEETRAAYNRASRPMDNDQTTAKRCAALFEDYANKGRGPLSFLYSHPNRHHATFAVNLAKELRQKNPEHTTDTEIAEFILAEFQNHLSSLTRFNPNGSLMRRIYYAVRHVCNQEAMEMPPQVFAKKKGNSKAGDMAKVASKYGGVATSVACAAVHTAGTAGTVAGAAGLVVGSLPFWAPVVAATYFDDNDPSIEEKPVSRLKLTLLAAAALVAGPAAPAVVAGAIIGIKPS